MRLDEALIDQDTDPTGAATKAITGLQIYPYFLKHNFMMRFKWVSNGFDNNHAGCSIDNLTISQMGDGSGNKEDYYNGTSMAAPHVAGLAALVQSKYPSLSIASIKAAILSKGDVLASLDGNVLTGKRINANNTLSYLGSSADITSVRLNNSINVIDSSIGANTIDITVPYKTGVTQILPVFDYNGKSISPASDTVQNFTNPVVYTVTAQDDSTKQYTVYVHVAISNEKRITNFSLQGIPSVTTIDEVNHAISVAVPYGTNVKNLIPVVTYTGSSVNPLSNVVKDFTNPVTYIVTAADSSTQAYSVTVIVRQDPFSDAKIKFIGDGKSSGSASSTKVLLKFDNNDNAAQYMISKKEDFSGASWQDYSGGSIKATVKEKAGKQKFYVKFKDADGTESAVLSKSVEYVVSKRQIKNSKSSLSVGDTLVQKGNSFSKNSDVQLFFSRVSGGFYAPQTIKTDKKGNFSVSYVVKKAAGKYSWYAVDVKTQKKSKTLTYTVK